jgi:hypothetical protein
MLPRGLCAGLCDVYMDTQLHALSVATLYASLCTLPLRRCMHVCHWHACICVLCICACARMCDLFAGMCERYAHLMYVHVMCMCVCASYTCACACMCDLFACARYVHLMYVHVMCMLCAGHDGEGASAHPHAQGGDASQVGGGHDAGAGASHDLFSLCVQAQQLSAKAVALTLTKFVKNARCLVKHFLESTLRLVFKV